MTNLISDIRSQTNLSHQEAIWLLEHITQKRVHQITDLTFDQKAQLDTNIDQIANQHKPLAYIIGWVPFLGLDCKVVAPILIPRPETEEWVEKLINQLEPYRDQIHSILDIGCGSGVIGLSLAKKFPLAQIWATDISPQAVQLTLENAQRNNITNIQVIQSDLMANIQGQKFDLIVSNPPYIPSKSMGSMAASVLDWEDHRALFAGADGSQILQAIVNQAKDHLSADSNLPYQLVLEIDLTQHELITQLAQKTGWNCTVTKDLFGNWRTAWCSKKA